MDYREIVTNIRAPVNDKGQITAISDNLYSKLFTNNITWVHSSGAASWKNEFHAPYGGLDIRSSYVYEAKEKKSDSCLDLIYNYNTPFKQLEKYDIPTLNDLKIIDSQTNHGVSHFSFCFSFYKGSKAKIRKLELFWDEGNFPHEQELILGGKHISFLFTESGDIEEMEVDHGIQTHTVGLNLHVSFIFDYKSNNILTSLDDRHVHCDAKKLWQDYIDGKVPSSDIKNPTYIHGTAFPFEVKYADKSIQHIESISTYIVDLDLNKHWVTFKI